MNSLLDIEHCVICEEGFSDDNPSSVVSRGLLNLLEFSKKREDANLTSYLENLKPTDVVRVHAQCRREYVDPTRTFKRSPPPDLHQFSPKKLRSNQPSFQWKTACFFCDGKIRKTIDGSDERHPDRHDPTVRHVRGKLQSVEMVNLVRKRCLARNDLLGSKVLTRLSSISDLVVEKAVYHSICYAQFFNDDDHPKAKGRPVNNDQQQAFNIMCEWLENENELYTLQELYEKMENVSAGLVYGTKRLKQKLKEKYGELIFFAEMCGRKDVVCFRSTANNILNDKWYEERKTSVEDEEKRIVETSAKLIKNAIRIAAQEVYSTEFFPSAEDVQLNWIPALLQQFLSKIISSPLKVEMIGQCIIKAAMPRSVLPPLLFGHAVDLDYLFGSKWLVTQDNRLGLSESYSEVNRFKQTVAAEDDIDALLES